MRVFTLPRWYRVALMLALPRPLQLERILPMISSLGVTTLVLCTASKVRRRQGRKWRTAAINKVQRWVRIS